MSRVSHLQFWRKSCLESHEAVWQQRLAPYTDRMAVLAQPGRASLRLEVYDLSPAEARGLKQKWGGIIRPQLPPRPQKPPNPIRIRQRLVVVSTEPQMETWAATGRAVLQIPAGMAFGTGDHATTATCLRLLADLDLNGKDFLDLGCGTGILGLAARKLGAAKVLAADFDPDAVRVTRENLRQNNLARVTVRQLDVLKWKPERQWPVVVANLFSGVLIEAAPTLATATESGGSLIFSGVLQSQAKAVCKSLTNNGFRIRSQVQRGKWFTALAVKR